MRSVLDRAFAAGVRSRELQRIEAVLTRAARGPAWSDSHSYDSRYYSVHSDISREVCLEAGAILDGAYRMFELQLGRVSGCHLIAKPADEDEDEEVNTPQECSSSAVLATKCLHSFRGCSSETGAI